MRKPHNHSRRSYFGKADKFDRYNQKIRSTDTHPLVDVRPSLHQLEVFVAVARDGNVRAAAERVSRSQSAASMAIADLEARLGQPLFDRAGRKLVLNANGARLLPRAIALLDHATEVELAVRDDFALPLRLAASLTIGNHLLPPLVAEWRRKHPAATVKLTIGNTREVADAVLAFEADLGFVEGSVQHEALALSAWTTDRMVICAAPGHGLAGRRASVADLAAADWIVREPGSGTRETVDAGLMKPLGWPRPAMELGSSEAIRHAVASGAGLCCLSRHAVEEALAAGTLVEIHADIAPPTRELAIIVHRDRRLSPGVTRFVEFCRAKVAGS
jgi:DNA-binding transcriptional LysR family regulator